MSGHGDETTAPEPDEDAEPLTAVAEPVVIDLRDGVDTVAAYEAEQARRAELAARQRG